MKRKAKAALAYQKPHPRYQEWLHFVFDRPVTPNGWYFDIEFPDFDAERADLAQLVANTMDNCGRDLASYSDDQVNHGLKFIFNNSFSDVVFSLMDETVPAPLRIHAISSIKNLYKDCFTPRCAYVLGHNDEQGANPLNSICYMLWDVSPLSYWENEPDREVFYQAVVEVLEDALASPNPACVESSLHGLGHILSSYIEPVTKVIAAYQRRNVFVSPQLKEYAARARTGNIQ